MMIQISVFITNKRRLGPAFQSPPHRGEFYSSSPITSKNFSGSTEYYNALPYIKLPPARSVQEKIVSQKRQTPPPADVGKN